MAQLDRNWLLLARSLSATRTETVLRVVLPGITAQILTGVRLAIGIIWIVLVPAEMLGVSAAWATSSSTRATAWRIRS